VVQQSWSVFVLRAYRRYSCTIADAHDRFRKRWIVPNDQYVRGKVQLAEHGEGDTTVPFPIVDISKAESRIPGLCKRSVKEKKNDVAAAPSVSRAHADTCLRRAFSQHWWYRFCLLQDVTLGSAFCSIGSIDNARGRLVLIMLDVSVARFAVSDP
jgi:hypothetical protein